MPANAPGDDEHKATTLPANGRAGLPSIVEMRLTQSIVFFSSGGIDALYSGLAISKPSWAAIRRPSRKAFSGRPGVLPAFFAYGGSIGRFRPAGRPGRSRANPKNGQGIAPEWPGAMGPRPVAGSR